MSLSALDATSDFLGAFIPSIFASWPIELVCVPTLSVMSCSSWSLLSTLLFVLLSVLFVDGGTGDDDELLPLLTYA